MIVFLSLLFPFLYMRKPDGKQEEHQVFVTFWENTGLYLPCSLVDGYSLEEISILELRISWQTGPALTVMCQSSKQCDSLFQF